MRRIPVRPFKGRTEIRGRSACLSVWLPPAPHRRTQSKAQCRWPRLPAKSESCTPERASMHTPEREPSLLHATLVPQHLSSDSACVIPRLPQSSSSATLLHKLSRALDRSLPGVPRRGCCRPAGDEPMEDGVTDRKCRRSSSRDSGEVEEIGSFRERQGETHPPIPPRRQRPSALQPSGCPLRVRIRCAGPATLCPFRCARSRGARSL